MVIPDPACEAARQKCLAALAATGKVPRQMRHELYNSLGPVEMEPDSVPRRSKFSPGLKRRLRLFSLAARKVLPIWQNLMGIPEAEMMLNLTEEYLAGRLEYAALEKQGEGFAPCMDNVQALPVSKRYAFCVGHATLIVAFTALTDEEFELDGFEDNQVDAWDGPYMACLAFAGDKPMGSPEYAAKWAEFWKWFLESAVPEAYASVPK